MKRPPEETLYQYRPPEGRAFANLREHQWYFQSPLKFNDPYDCGIVPVIKGEFTVKQYIRFCKKNPELGLPPTREGRDKFVREYNKNPKERWDELRGQVGVSCFSERKDNLRMWSYYSNGGKGFCLQFNTEDEAFKDGRILKVIYPANMPSANAVKLWLAKDSKPIFKIMTRKSKDWMYEREWRLFRENVGVIKYQPKSIKAVYLGTESTPETQGRALSIVREVYPHAELWQGYLSTKKIQSGFLSHKRRCTRDICASR